MKYIMLETQLQHIRRRVPIIFPDFMVHEDIARLFHDFLIHRHEMFSNVISAGDIDLGLVECSGRSETLKIESSPDDNQTINSYDYFNGIIE